MLLLNALQITAHDGKWFINPGSVTGAYSAHGAIAEEVVPSFILLAIQGSKCVTYVYELKAGEVEVSKSEFSKAP
jgi:vacuolar protein sorting-associated protein 29